MNGFQKIRYTLTDFHFLYEEKDRLLYFFFYHFFTFQSLCISNKSVTHTHTHTHTHCARVIYFFSFIKSIKPFFSFAGKRSFFVRVFFLGDSFQLRVLAALGGLFSHWIERIIKYQYINSNF